MKRTLFFTVFLLLFSSFFVTAKTFTVSNGLGVGLLATVSSFIGVPGEEQCVTFAVGNPGNEDINAVITADGPISLFYTRNEPDNNFVPSGTFYYNNSCCLLPANICFLPPYVFGPLRVAGSVFANFGRANTQLSSSSGAAKGTSVTVGSSVSHRLELVVSPVDKFILSPGSSACYKYYLNGTNFSSSDVSGSLKEIYDANAVANLWNYDEFDPTAVKPVKFGPAYCFKTSLFSFGNVIYSGDLLVDGIGKESIKIKVTLNYYLIGAIAVIIAIIIWIVLRIKRKVR